MKRVFIACAALVSMMMVACTANTAKTEAEQPDTTQQTEETQSVVTSDIAYLDIELALSQSDIFQNEGVPLQKKTEKAQAGWADKEKSFQAEAAKLQEKYQRGLITTNNAQLEEEKIRKKVTDYQAAAQKEAAKLDEENVVFSNRTRDLLQRAVNEVNADKKYKMIINASALVDADTSLNITPQILEVVNKLYKEDNK